jgi:hypothetical protein
MPGKKTAVTILYIAILCSMLVGCARFRNVLNTKTTRTPTGISVKKTVSPSTAITIPLPPVQSETPVPPRSPTLISSPSITFTAQPSKTATQLEARVIGASLLDFNQLLISLELKELITVQYSATVDGRDYTCEVLSEYPNRLYCHGPLTRVGGLASLKLFKAGDPNPVFENLVPVPLPS